MDNRTQAKTTFAPDLNLNKANELARNHSPFRTHTPRHAIGNLGNTNGHHFDIIPGGRGPSIVRDGDGLGRAGYDAPFGDECRHFQNDQIKEMATKFVSKSLA